MRGRHKNDLRDVNVTRYMEEGGRHKVCMFCMWTVDMMTPM